MAVLLGVCNCAPCCLVIKELKEAGLVLSSSIWVLEEDFPLSSPGIQRQWKEAELYGIRLDVEAVLLS
ncbi:MAG: hypothetical protein ACLRWP_12960 [Bilophila wadsworthia]